MINPDVVKYNRYVPSKKSKYKVGDIVKFQDRAALGYDNNWTTDSGKVIENGEMFMVVDARWVNNDGDADWEYSLTNSRLVDSGWTAQALEPAFARASDEKSGKIKMRGHGVQAKQGATK